MSDSSTSSATVTDTEEAQGMLRCRKSAMSRNGPIDSDNSSSEAEMGGSGIDPEKRDEKDSDDGGSDVLSDVCTDDEDGSKENGRNGVGVGKKGDTAVLKKKGYVSWRERGKVAVFADKEMEDKVSDTYHNLVRWTDKRAGTVCRPKFCSPANGCNCYGLSSLMRPEAKTDTTDYKAEKARNDDAIRRLTLMGFLSEDDSKSDGNTVQAMVPSVASRNDSKRSRVPDSVNETTSKRRAKALGARKDGNHPTVDRRTRSEICMEISFQRIPHATSELEDCLTDLVVLARTIDVYGVDSPETISCFFSILEPASEGASGSSARVVFSRKTRTEAGGSPLCCYCIETCLLAATRADCYEAENLSFSFKTFWDAVSGNGKLTMVGPVVVNNAWIYGHVPMYRENCNDNLLYLDVSEAKRKNKRVNPLVEQKGPLTNKLCRGAVPPSADALRKAQGVCGGRGVWGSFHNRTYNKPYGVVNAHLKKYDVLVCHNNHAHGDILVCAGEKTSMGAYYVSRSWCGDGKKIRTHSSNVVAYGTFTFKPLEVLVRAFNARVSTFLLPPGEDVTDDLPQLEIKRELLDSNNMFGVLSKEGDTFGIGDLFGMNEHELFEQCPELSQLLHSIEENLRFSVNEALRKELNFKAYHMAGLFAGKVVPGKAPIMEEPHLACRPEVLQLMHNSNHFGFVIITPLSKAGVWLRIYPEFPGKVTRGVVEFDSESEKDKSSPRAVQYFGKSIEPSADFLKRYPYKTTKADGVLVFVDYGSCLLLPMTMIHAAGMVTHGSGNPYMKLFLFMENQNASCSRSLFECFGQKKRDAVFAPQRFYPFASHDHGLSYSELPSSIGIPDDNFVSLASKDFAEHFVLH